MRLKQPSLTEAHSTGMRAFHEGKDIHMPPAQYDKKHVEAWKWGHSHAKATSSEKAQPVADTASASEGTPRQEGIREIREEAKKKRGNRTAQLPEIP